MVDTDRITDTKKILVTGGCGFVGRHLIARLSQEPKTDIWVIDDLSIGHHPAAWESPATFLSRVQPYRNATVFELGNHRNNLIFINADFLSIALSELGRQPHFGCPKLPQFDEIYHLASIVGGRALIENDPLMVGIDLAIDSCFFLWAVKANRPKSILYASSSAAYPISKQRAGSAVALQENMISFGEGFLQPDLTYGWSKLTGEYLATIAAKQYGLSTAVVRPFSGYGEDQDISYPVPAIALKFVAGQNPVKVWGSGEQGRDFVYIDDCVEAMVLACRKISDGSAVNIGSGVLTSFRELASLMMDIEGRKVSVQGLDKKPVGVAQRYCDSSYVKELLGWSPSTSLREGVEKVLAKAKKRFNEGIRPID